MGKYLENLIKKNFWLKLFSLIFAVIIWAYVVGGKRKIAGSGEISIVRSKKISTIENMEDLRNQLLKNLKYQYDHGHSLIKSISELLFGKYGEK